MSTTIKVTISGVAYSAAVECSNVPADGNWPTPTYRRVGKGYQYVYECTLAVAADIQWHLEQLGELWASCSDDEWMGRDGRACLKDAARIEAQLKPFVEAGLLYRDHAGFHTVK